MSNITNSFIRLGGARPSSKISEARIKLSLVSNEPVSPANMQIMHIAETITSAIRLGSLVCQVCLERKPSAEFTGFGKCEHKFCKSCILAYLTTKIFINEIDIKCLDEDCR